MYLKHIPAFWNRYLQLELVDYAINKWNQLEKHLGKSHEFTRIMEKITYSRRKWGGGENNRGWHPFTNPFPDRGNSPSQSYFSKIMNFSEHNPTSGGSERWVGMMAVDLPLLPHFQIAPPTSLKNIEFSWKESYPQRKWVGSDLTPPLPAILVMSGNERLLTHTAS